MGTPNLVVSSANTRWQTVSTEIEREHECLDICRSKAATIPEEGPRNTSSKSYLGVEGWAYLIFSHTTMVDCGILVP